ncbi:MAG: tetratricopeptide repeat protein [Bryobacteraceae bacterium]|jgi:tetratricopeptide (TPR) repeat protein
MKKTKSPRPGNLGAASSAVAAPPVRTISWWPWAALLSGLFLVIEVYTPALSGAFVLDDRYLPFFDPHATDTFWGWVGTIRPLLMLSFWLNYKASGAVDPFIFHVTNVCIHFLTSVFVVFIAAKFLEWSNVAGRARDVLAVFSGAVFLLHPLQTEAVAYVAGRSDSLSALFFFAAFTVFLYRQYDSVTFPRAVAILVLFGAAVATKEYSLTLPVLLLFTDFFWNRGGVRKNAILYGLLACAGVAGGAFVFGILRASSSAGFSVAGVSPLSYFFTQCRVIWIYIRMFFLPYGQNIDPDIPLSHSLIDHGAIFGLIALIALAVAAWTYRKRFPLAAFGVFLFLLLIAPTSSIVPIKDVLSERRLYLPSIGLIFIALELFRRMKLTQAVWTGAAVLVACLALTYQRTAVWASPLSLWQDTVEKSPNKYRPRFQLAYELYDSNQCPAAVQSYAKAAQLGPADDQLLVDWALALDCAGQSEEAIAKLNQAVQLAPTAHIYSQIGMVNAKHGNFQEALQALAQAEKIDPSYDMTYVYRGLIYEKGGDKAAAALEYKRALELHPSNQVARDALARVSR